MTDHQERLDWIKTTLATVPEGAAALHLAKLTNVSISFDDTMPYDPVKKTGTCGTFIVDSIKGLSIVLNPAYPNTKLVQTLAHELRHLWQHTKTNFDHADKLRPIDCIAFMRLIEGDANAFAALVAAKIRKVTKLDLACHVYGTISPIDLMRGLQRKPDFIMPLVFKNFQETFFNKENASAYETDLLAKMKNLKAEANPYTMHKSLSETFNNISDILAIEGTKTKRNYLDAKDADDYVNKIEKMLRDDVRTEAKSYTNPKKSIFFGP